MKIVIIGGTGRIGSKVVADLKKQGHKAIAAAPDTGVNTITGEGLAEALDGAAAVVDVSNSPSSDGAESLKFFETSTVNLRDAEVAAGVKHHTALSIIGTDRLLASEYFRGKMAQETLVEASPIPYTIVRATQFYEFLGSIADQATEANTVRLPAILFQPMAAEDVAVAIIHAAVSAPANGTVEVAGPDQFHLDDLVRRVLTARHDPRKVITDPNSSYFGIDGLGERTLLPGDNATLGEIHFDDWLKGQRGNHK